MWEEQICHAAQCPKVEIFFQFFLYVILLSRYPHSLLLSRGVLGKVRGREITVTLHEFIQ